MTEKSTTILVVDDDAQVRRMLRRLLEGEGYAVLEASGSGEAVGALGTGSVDLVTLDLNLGGDDGLSVARQIRASSDIPIIMITGKGDMVDRIVGLELGADDYIAKPFHLREVLARIRSVLRRAAGNATTGTATVPAPPATPANPSVERRTFSFGGWVLDVDARELFGPDGNPCHLTTGEFELLQVFVRHPNHVLTRDQIMDKVKGYDWTPTDRSIDNQVVRLRKKIEADPRNPRLLKTVRGAGYCFTATAS